MRADPRVWDILKAEGGGLIASCDNLHKRATLTLTSLRELITEKEAGLGFDDIEEEDEDRYDASPSSFVSAKSPERPQKVEMESTLVAEQSGDLFGKTVESSAAGAGSVLVCEPVTSSVASEMLRAALFHAYSRYMRSCTCMVHRSKYTGHGARGPDL